jgi:hypothetical protein
MRNVAPVDMWRPAPKVAVQAGGGFLKQNGYSERRKFISAG